MTFPSGPAGTMALVRFRVPGERPTYRSLALGGLPQESLDEIEAFILAHLEGQAACWQGWLLWP